MDIFSAQVQGLRGPGISATDLAVFDGKVADAEAARQDALDARDATTAASDLILSGLADTASVFDTRAQAEAGLGAVPDGRFVHVFSDEARDDNWSLFYKFGGELVFKKDLSFANRELSNVRPTSLSFGTEGKFHLTLDGPGGSAMWSTDTQGNTATLRSNRVPGNGEFSDNAWAFRDCSSAHGGIGRERLAIGHQNAGPGWNSIFAGRNFIETSFDPEVESNTNKPTELIFVVSGFVNGNPNVKAGRFLLNEGGDGGSVFFDLRNSFTRILDIPGYLDDVNGNPNRVKMRAASSLILDGYEGKLFLGTDGATVFAGAGTADTARGKLHVQDNVAGGAARLAVVNVNAAASIQRASIVFGNANAIQASIEADVYGAGDLRFYTNTNALGMTLQADKDLLVVGQVIHGGGYLIRTTGPVEGGSGAQVVTLNNAPKPGSPDIWLQAVINGRIMCSPWLDLGPAL